MGRLKSHLQTAGLLALLLLLAQSVPVRAHALLTHSVPVANTELSQPPATVEMWFSEPLESGFSGARLLASSGEEVPTGAAIIDPGNPNHMSLPLERLEPGIYTVAWQTLSQVDGHEWYGSFPFTVLNPDGSRPAGGAAAVANDGGRGELPTPGEAISRWLALMGGILLVGAPLFRLVVAPERPRRPPRVTRSLVVGAVWIGALLLIIGGWSQLLLQAMRLGGVSDVTALLLATRTGFLHLARQLLLFTGLLIVLTLPQPAPLRGGEQPAFWLVAIVGIGLLLLLVLAGYTEEPLLLAGTAIFAGTGMGLAGWLGRERPEVTVTKRASTRGAPTGAALSGASEGSGWATERPAWRAFVLLAAAILLSFSVGSHAGAVSGYFWAILGDFLHFLAAGAWLGGLLLLPALLWLAWRNEDGFDAGQLLPLVRRFSYMAGFAVLVLVLTGLFNSLVELTSLASLVTTAYGLVLLVKLVLVALALGVAFFNNRIVHGTGSSHPRARTHRQGDGASFASRLSQFRRQVGLEAAIALGLMLSVAVLVQTPAPRSAATDEPSQAAMPFNTILTTDDLAIHAQVNPNEVGNNRFWLHLYHPDGSSIGEVQLVQLRFNYQEAQLGQASVDLEPLGQNTFAVEGTYLNQAGTWQVSVYVRRRGMDDALTSFALQVAPASVESRETSPWQNPLAHLFPGEQTDTNPFPATAASVAHGRALYEQHCLACHGPEGLGNGPLGLTLQPPPVNLQVHMVPGAHTDRQIFEWISNGVPNSAMPAFVDVLTEEERWHIVNYIRTFALETK